MLLALYSCDSSGGGGGADDPVAEESYEGDVALDGFVDNADLNFGKVSVYDRVDMQVEFAEAEKVILDEWVAIGHEYSYSIMLDYTKPFGGKPSLYVEMTDDDPTDGTDKTAGRCEVSFCYVTEEEFYANNDSGDTYEECQLLKQTYHYGHGIIPQDCTSYHQFSIYVSSDLNPAVKTIFAQWHGMPDRRLTQSPDGVIKMLTTDEFVELCETTYFVENIGYDIETDEENGWIVEQGGYPPIAFGFQDGFLYVQANSDRKWLSDKDERCNVNPSSDEVMVVKTTDEGYKTAVIAGKLPYEDFPKDCWVTFDVAIKWSEYSGTTEVITKSGWIDVLMKYGYGDGYTEYKLVDKQTVNVGRNDEYGYYFKYGIYRSSGTVDGEVWMSTFYNVAGYSQWF